MKDEDKHHVRTLEEINAEGEAISTTIVYDLEAMLREHGLLPEPDKKDKPGELIPFPK
ncbi:MAG: hypothetical protein ACYDDN_07470 [Candidatus Desulforudaceae bacterium]